MKVGGGPDQHGCVHGKMPVGLPRGFTEEPLQHSEFLTAPRSHGPWVPWPDGSGFQSSRFPETQDSGAEEVCVPGPSVMSHKHCEGHFTEGLAILYCFLKRVTL